MSCTKFTVLILVTVSYQPSRSQISNLNLTNFETIPHTAKNLSAYTDDYSGYPEVSLCTRMGTNRAEDGQLCHPIKFWIDVCETEVKDVEKYMTQIINEGENWESANFDPYCLDYNLTWPHCVSKKDRPHLCEVWRRLHKFERKYLTLFYKYDFRKNGKFKSLILSKFAILLQFFPACANLIFSFRQTTSWALF